MKEIEMQVKHTHVYRSGSGNYDPLTECAYIDKDGHRRAARLPGHLSPDNAQRTIDRLNMRASAQVMVNSIL